MPRTQHQTDEADRYALALLDHDGLMTPRLFAEFGPLLAVQTAAILEAGVFRRQSVLRTIAGAKDLLEADLKISVSALPDGLLARLQKSETPFGQLLMDYGIDIRFSDRQIYRHPEAAGGEGRWARRLTMWRADTGAHLCDVHEVLFPAHQLLALHRTAKR